MEMMKRLGNSKGQLMSIAVLVFVLLMVASLLLLVIVSIGYNGVLQSSVISSSSINYGTSLRQSAYSFAHASGSAALNALFVYESNATLRKTNLISNFSKYMQYLMVNGTLPNVAPGSAGATIISNLMGGSTLSSYNSIISSVTGSGSKNITISETRPIIFQSNPYSVSIQYNEYVHMNTSAGVFGFTIPVNVSIPINNTPDLFYAQQGVYKPITFSSTSGLATVIGNDYASSGNATSFIYGTVNVISPQSGCPSSLSSILPYPLYMPPYNSQIIVVTPNAVSLTTSCSLLNGVGGLITNQLNTPPAIPYLNFSATNNALQYLQSGQSVLLYGPGLDVLNITKLISSINSGAYFTSPFAPSFSDRAAGNLQLKSPNGIFTFSGFNRQGAFFNGNSYIVTSEQQYKVVNYTVAAWIYPESMNGASIDYDRGPTGAGDSLDLVFSSDVGLPLPQGSMAFGLNSNNVFIGVNTLDQLATNHWYFVVGTFNSISGSAVAASDFKIYLNGILSAQLPITIGSAPSSPLSGAGGILIGDGFNGIISNLQIYNSTLSSYQVLHLYQEGIEGLPVANGTKLLGWYPLNGNAQDFSGQSTTLPHQISYQLIPGYTRDSILTGNYSQFTYPIPGVDNCDTYSECINYSTPHLYLGDSPLSAGTAQISAAYFTSNSAYFEQGSGFKYMESQGGSSPTVFTNPFSLSIWVYPESANGMIIDERGQAGLAGQWAGSIWQDSWLNLVSGTVYMSIWQGAGANACTSLGTIPLNRWSNIAMTYASGTLSGYINGVYQAHASVTRSAPGGYAGNGGTSIGATMFYPLGMADPSQACIAPGSSGVSPGGVSFTGMMANYQWYSSTLSQPQITALYNSGLTGAPVNSISIMGWWPLNGNLNDYSGFQNTGVSNDLAFQYINSNSLNLASSSASTSIGISSLSGVNGEWQTLGFGQKSVQPVYWNVTAWNLSSTSSNSIPYATENTYPLDPAGTYPFQNGAFFSGIPGGDQQWNFGNFGYMGSIRTGSGYTNFYGTGLSSQFPFAVNTLNNYVGCSANAYNSTGFTAVATMPLSGTYDIQQAADDTQEIWYRNPVAYDGSSAYSNGNWIPVSSPSTGTWCSAHPTATCQAINVSFVPATYQVVVSQQNGCYGGLSALSMQAYASQVWAVNAFALPVSDTTATFSSVFGSGPSYNPLSPDGATLVQEGMWFGGAIGGPQKWAFGTIYEQYTATTPQYQYFGLGLQPFPKSLGSLNAPDACSGSYNAPMYVATATMYLSTAPSFYVDDDDQMVIFYRPVGGSWTYISAMTTGTTGPWPSAGGGQGPEATPYGPYSFSSFSPGPYQIAVVWDNICNGGESSFLMNP